MSRGKVLLGFSGGVDSCASVEILRAEGYEVGALFLDVMGDEMLVENARFQADRLGVELLIDDVVEQFDAKIVNYFVDGYLRGETPAPCTRCNPEIKWHRIEQIADQQGYKYIATGHYFRVEQHRGKYYVGTGRDLIKDQSYYLWGLKQSTLARILTPMGDKIKGELRSQNAQRESMGVCFLRGRSYGELIKERYGEIPRGEIVDKSGVVVGVHDGYPFYTIGQKRGFELFDKSAKESCIIGICAEKNRLTIGENANLFHHNLVLRDCNVVDIEEVISTRDSTIKIRGYGKNPEGFVKVTVSDDSPDGSIRLNVELKEPAWAIAKGQPAVIYCRGRVIGGGYVDNYF